MIGKLTSFITIQTQSTNSHDGSQSTNSHDGSQSTNISDGSEHKPYWWIRAQTLSMDQSLDRMLAAYTTTCAISAHHHQSWEFEPRSWRGVLDTTVCDKVCQWRAIGLRFSPDSLVSSTNTTDCHNITEILLKVALHTITSTLSFHIFIYEYH
jgi:hypothetical protein